MGDLRTEAPSPDRGGTTAPLRCRELDSLQTGGLPAAGGLSVVPAGSGRLLLLRRPLSHSAGTALGLLAATAGGAIVHLPLGRRLRAGRAGFRAAVDMPGGTPTELQRRRRPWKRTEDGGPRTDAGSRPHAGRMGRLPGRSPFRPAVPLIALLLLAPGSTLARAASLPAPPTPSILARRLAGRWLANTALSERLTGRKGPLPELSFDIDPQVLERLPSKTEPLLRDNPVRATGHLSIDGGPFLFALVDDGNPVLLVFPTRRGSLRQPFRLYVALAPAADFDADLLFVGGVTPAEPFSAYSRAPTPAEAGLTDASKALLHTILQGHLSPEMDAALEALPRRPDWKAALHHLVGGIRYTLPEDQNNSCLAIDRVLRRHPEAEIDLDLAPLLSALRLPIWTSQQKCAEAVAEYVSHRQVSPEVRNSILASLIPLTESPRGRVVDPALRALVALSGQDLGRDPPAWARWFEKTSGTAVDLERGRYETLAVVRPVSDARRDTHLFSVDGAASRDLESTVRDLEGMARRAKEEGKAFSVVLQLPDAVFSSSSGDRVIRAGGPLVERLQEAGIRSVTLSPESDRFYPPPPDESAPGRARAPGPSRRTEPAEPGLPPGDRGDASRGSRPRDEPPSGAHPDGGTSVRRIPPHTVVVPGAPGDPNRPGEAGGPPSARPAGSRLSGTWGF